MGLPIAVGGRAVSSKTIADCSPLPEDADDGTALEPVMWNSAPLLTTAVSQDQKLGATCTLSFYDMIREDDGTMESTRAEIRIQISHLAKGYSTTYRDVLHRIPLPSHERKEEYDPIQPCTVFASDGRHLACLIPCPCSNRSVVVIFQLRKPRDETVALPPRPSYLGPAPSTPIIPIATNPSVVHLPNETPLTKASSICNALSSSNACVLLAGCMNGRIVVIAYRPTQVAGILYQEKRHGMITFLNHQTESHDAVNGSRGKLVAIDKEGTAVIFSSHSVVSETNNVVLMQLQHRFELKGPFLPSGAWMGSSFLALLVKPQAGQSASAQVWPIDNHDSPLEPLSTLYMTPERLHEYAHGSLSFEQDDDDDIYTDSFSESTAAALHYDECSGCLAVSSFVLLTPRAVGNFAGALPFACIWHWRTNVVGLTLTCRSQCFLLEQRHAAVWHKPILSRLYFSSDFQEKPVLVHFTGKNRIQKFIYNLAHLSPSETLAAGACVPPLSLMVSSKCVSFPCVSRPFAGQEVELCWKDSHIPFLYTSAFGAPRLASIGRQHGRSIAVAASRGLCVLDCSRVQNSDCHFNQATKSVRIEQPKWRLFGSEAEERAFCVVAMTWWEGDKDTTDETLSDDLLVAVIEAQDDTGRRYLACWSPRRLDMGHQMMVTAHGNATSVRLPAGFNPTSISLLCDPCSYAASDSAEVLMPPRKAVLLLCDNGGVDTSYELFQLTLRRRKADQDAQGSNPRIVANLCSNGTLPKSANSGVFLASASFDFESENSNPFLATVGIIRSPGKGVEAVMIASSDVMRKEIISSSVAGQEVSSYWHSHTIRGNNSSRGGKLDRFFVWSIELCNGTLMCWKVPYLPNVFRKVDDEVDSNDVTRHTTNGANGTSRPTENHSEADPALFGSITTIGDSSCWMQETSAANRTGFTLGSIPSTPFGCFLRCAQSGRQLHGAVAGTDVDHPVFCLGNTELAPPSFVPSLFASLLVAVENSGGLVFSPVAMAAFSSLKDTVPEDTFMVALKLLVIRTVELISRATDRTENDQLTRQSLFLLTSVFEDIVDVARKSLSPMQFASLFLGIGRQMEPSHLPHLFPLPRTRTHEPAEHCSVEDLFLDSIRNGSITVPSSALPLFSSKIFSLKMCGSLLWHCLVTIGANADSPLLASFDISVEERRLLRGIFRFGVKIEDSGSMPHLEAIHEGDPIDIFGGLNGDTETYDYYSDSSSDANGDDRPVAARRKNGTSRNSAGICRLFTPSFFLGSRGAAKAENEIVEAASSFIESGFDDSTYDSFEPAQNGHHAIDSPGAYHHKSSAFHCQPCEKSMAGTVASFLLPMVFDTTKPDEPFRWRRTSKLAQVLLGDSYVDIDAFATAKIGEFLKLIEGVTHEELISSLQIPKASLQTGQTAQAREQWLVGLLKVHLADCGSNATPAEAMSILHLVLKLLIRHNIGEDMEVCIPGLVCLAVIVGHRAGYKKELLGGAPNIITKAYSAALNDEAE